MNRMKPFLDGGIPFDIKSFENTPIELAPVYGWNFNDILDKDTIKKQIDDMCRAGIRAVYVIPEPKNFRANIPTMLEPDYLTEEYMEYFGFAAWYAKQKGMVMWLYDEGGWPSGSACGEVYKRDKSTAKKHLDELRRELKIGEEYKISKEAVAVFKGGVRIFKSFTADADTEVFEYVVVDDSLQYAEVGNRKTPYKTMLSFVGNTDVSETKTVDLFIEITHEKYRKHLGDEFGSSFTMMFTDEPRPAATAWFTDIAERFYERYGYSLLDNLPALFATDYGDRVRMDYHELCGDNLRSVFFDRIRKWCNENNLLFCGHVDLDNLTEGGATMNYGSTLNLLRGMDVPGVDVIWRQIYPYSDGRRVSEGTCPFFPRMASSAASQSGGNLSLTESLGVYGLGVTMDEMRFVFNYQAIRGVNLMNPLLISYGTRAHFGFGERPYFNGEIPGHDDLTLINDYYSRISYLTAIGRRTARTALYISAEALNAGGETCLRFAESFDKLGEMLEKSGIDFDIIDGKGVLEGTLSDGGLKLGAACYESIIVPDGAVMNEKISAIISSLVGESTPLMESDIGFDSLRVSSRVFDNGDVLYLCFNESNDRLSANLKIADTRNSYILDPKNGRAYASEATVEEGSRIGISLESGEMLGIFFTENGLEVSRRAQYRNKYELSEFEIRGVRKFVIDKSGFYDVRLNEDFRPARLGEWSLEFGRDFSGEAEYRCRCVLENTGVGRAKLSLGRLCHSASVYINGSFVGCAGLSPCEVEFSSELLKSGTNEIIIRVANTASNQMLYSDAEDNWTAQELTPYNDRALEFEADSVESGLFGPISLWSE